jgi:hypothetical protein
MKTSLAAVAAAAGLIFALAPQPWDRSPRAIVPAPGKTNDAKASYYLADACYIGQVTHRLNASTEGEIVLDHDMTTHGIVVTVSRRKLQHLSPADRERFLRVLVTGWQMCQHRYVAEGDRADGASVIVKDDAGRVVHRGVTKPD